jgi:hypothetical protein
MENKTIMDTAVVCYDDEEVFIDRLNAKISYMQHRGDLVDVQYQFDRGYFTALVIGRR